MALAGQVFNRADHAALRQRCHEVRAALIQSKLFAAQANSSTARWRISPFPFLLSHDHLVFFDALGTHLLAFYRALNRLYFASVGGTQPDWVASYLDLGKPESLIASSRLEQFRELLPDVIRPDLIPTDTGMVITELDSVPGGIGLTACMAEAYGKLAITSVPPYAMVSGDDGMVRGFAGMLSERLAGRNGSMAIVVSEEARDYRPEMDWIASRLRKHGLAIVCIAPEEIRANEEGLWLARDHRPIALVYRFFELFDLANVPNSERIMALAQRGQVVVTPPFKPQLEEKLAFALFHHPALTEFWQRELGQETYTVLSQLLPRTWVLDPHPLPSASVLPDLQVDGRRITDWRDLGRATQKGRRYVIKPSGFSPLAWGSRGVLVGHDMPQAAWAAAIEHALARFQTNPHVLQEFHKGRQFELAYYDERDQAVIPMVGRARLSPYYFVQEGKAQLAGILATVCPLDKKLIHGMRDAIMAPCAVMPGDLESVEVRLSCV